MRYLGVLPAYDIHTQMKRWEVLLSEKTQLKVAIVLYGWVSWFGLDTHMSELEVQHTSIKKVLIVISYFLLYERAIPEKVEAVVSAYNHPEGQRTQGRARREYDVEVQSQRIQHVQIEETVD